MRRTDGDPSGCFFEASRDSYHEYTNEVQFMVNNNRPNAKQSWLQSSQKPAKSEKNMVNQIPLEKKLPPKVLNSIILKLLEGYDLTVSNIILYCQWKNCGAQFSTEEQLSEHVKRTHECFTYL